MCVLLKVILPSVVLTLSRLAFLMEVKTLIGFTASTKSNISWLACLAIAERLIMFTLHTVIAGNCKFWNPKETLVLTGLLRNWMKIMYKWITRVTIAQKERNAQNNFANECLDVSMYPNPCIEVLFINLTNTERIFDSNVVSRSIFLILFWVSILNFFHSSIIDYKCTENKTMPPLLRTILLWHAHARQL